MSWRRRMATLCAYCLPSMLPCVTLAQAPSAQAPKSELKDIVKNYSLDLSIPDSPGLAIVGLSSENVLRPATPRALGLALQQGRDADGKPVQGFALDLAPVKLLVPALSKADYRKSHVARALWRTQLSMGVGQPLSDADKSTRVGLGLSSVLWRSVATDPLLDGQHHECISKALTAALPATMPVVLGPQPAASVPAKAPTLKSCYDGLAERTGNESALVVGLAGARISGDKGAVPVDARPRGAWVSLSYGFDGIESLRKALQFTASYRHMSNDLVADPNDATKFVVQDSRLVGARLYALAEVANTFVEVSEQRSHISGRARERTRRYVLGVERKVSDGVWLALAVGQKSGSTDGNTTTFNTGLKFGFDSQPVIEAPK